jgi:hypothetical protein
MESGTKQGDESGIGGVVTPSHRTGGVVAPAAVEHVSTYACGPMTLPLTPCVDLLKEIRGEEGPAGRRKLRATTKTISGRIELLLGKGVCTSGRHAGWTTCRRPGSL